MTNIDVTAFVMCGDAMGAEPSKNQYKAKHFAFSEKGDGADAHAAAKVNEALDDDYQALENTVHNYQNLIIRLAALLLVLWLIFFVFLGVIAAPTNDMQPRIDAGDTILVYRLDTDVQAQDVIVLEKEVDGEKITTVSRVVAGPGDTVEITEEGQLIVNGNHMIETNIYGSTRPYESSDVTYPLTLGADECFVLADTREGGMDSRYFGPVSKDEIVGTVIAIWRRVNL